MKRGVVYRLEQRQIREDGKGGAIGKRFALDRIQYDTTVPLGLDQRITSVECVAHNDENRFGDRCVCQTRAVEKCILANPFQIVSDGYLCY